MSAVASEAPATLSVTRLTGSIAAEVEGADLTRELPHAVAAQIRKAFAEHLVLVFRNLGGATPEAQHRWPAVSGEPQPLAIFQFLGALQASITFDPGSRIVASKEAAAPKASAAVAREELQNLGLAGEFDGWHSDSTFTPWLPKAAV